MNVKLYHKWLKFIKDEFSWHWMLKKENGLEKLAQRVWNYDHYHPNSKMWVNSLKKEFKIKYVEI